MTRAFLKGNDAAVCGALTAGCRAFFGYPITPASDFIQTAIRFFPQAGALAMQAENEIAAINMVYGAAACGTAAMTATSGPGLSLMQEGISYLAAARLPAVIIDIMRAGPGLGNIAPEQSDYFAATKGGGHGHYRVPVLAPGSVQEMFDLTREAFDWAFQYRTPVILLADAFVGQMMETVSLPDTLPQSFAEREHAALTFAALPDTKNVVSTLELNPDALARKNDDRFEGYDRIQRECQRAQDTTTNNTQTVCIAFGICARLAQETCTHSNARAALFRPISLWPFPQNALTRATQNAKKIVVIEANRGQMLEDIQRLAPTKNIVHVSKDGGTLPTAEDILQAIHA